MLNAAAVSQRTRRQFIRSVTNPELSKERMDLDLCAIILRQARADFETAFADCIYLKKAIVAFLPLAYEAWVMYGPFPEEVAARMGQVRAAQHQRAVGDNIRAAQLYPYESPRHGTSSVGSYRGRDYAEYTVHAREAYDPTTYGYDDISPRSGVDTTVNGRSVE